MQIIREEHLGPIPEPANLRINDQIRTFREDCRRNGCERPYHHFAFGQSPFPPPPVVTEALAAHASQHHYLPTAGLPELREAVARYYRHHFALECRAEQVVISPGSKEMIAMLLAVLRGSVLIPTPSWVSYLPQARILRKPVLPLKTLPEDGFKVTPELLSLGLEQTSTKQKVLILNHPHNPTGAVYSHDELKDLADLCRRHGVVVISDEIYALTSFEPGRFVSMMRVYPEGTVVTGGLSKDRSCGGYRLGVGIFPEEPRAFTEDVLKIAGSTYSCVAAPIQHAALVAYSLDPEVEDYVRQCWEINAVVGSRMAALLSEFPELQTTVPHGAFYLYVDFNEHRDGFMKLGLKTCREFAQDLLQVEHTALLPGDALLLPNDDFSVRCSFVDYDGAAALATWRGRPAESLQEKEAFVRENCPLIVEGVANIGRYLEQVRAGSRPRHFM